ncbi:EF-P 5-aminopentanol modification-associated protein YfmH [Lentibacillus saliphilus]|uniref:EF-P 5-aminopentanol modification-associated protein YfmH n=1 Tax=Lentibacillus saliphilus TaxID=2737028 RepID=UPI001C311BE8
MNKFTYDDISETIYKTTLSNGLTVCLIPREEMAKTYGVFSTNYGSIDRMFTPFNQQEPISVPDGIAHFLEHKLFEKEDHDVFADFGKQGASANAFTSFTETAYLFSATSRIQENVTTLLDFVQDPYFSDQSVEKEKGIITQEITMYDDQPDWRMFMETIKAMYHDHPVNIDIAGTAESIQLITKDDLYTCYNTFYHPSNMTLVVAGRFDPNDMLKLIEMNQSNKTFSEVLPINRVFPDEPTVVAKKEHVFSMPVSTPKCTIGIKEPEIPVDGDAFLKKELFMSMFLDFFFSKSGAFYEQLYQKDLIDDSFYFETNLNPNFGYALIGSNTTHPDVFAEHVKHMLLTIGQNEVSLQDFERMKKKKIGQLLMAMNSLEFTANKFIHYDRLGIDLFSMINVIQSLSVEEAQQFLKNWIKPDQIAVCKLITE